MRNSSRYAAMYRVHDRAEQMAKLCNDTCNMLLTSDDYAIKDMLKEVIGRLMVISSTASQAARDEYDFGANGSFLPYTIKNAVREVLQQEGLISVKGDSQNNAP